LQEYRTRVEANIEGRLLQELMATSFEASPYRNPVLGWPSDIGNLRASWARRFFQENYIPSNIVMALVGDVNPAEVKQLAERYFGPMPSRPVPYGMRTNEPPQTGPKIALVGGAVTNVMAVGFKRPPRGDKDGPVFDLLQTVLSGGRSGLLFRYLVEEQRIALNAQAVAAYPDTRYVNLFVFLIASVPGHLEPETEKALTDFLARLQVAPTVLQRAKLQLRTAVLRRLSDNAGIASMIANTWAEWADWRKMFTTLDEIDKITADDIQRVVGQYLVPANRTIVYLAPAEARQ
jgi:predicted Zn-dependent peptidase